MASEFVLNFLDGRSLGSVEQIQTMLQRFFPNIKFHRTTCGLEKLRIAKECGIVFPPAMQEILPSLPSLLEGVAEGEDWRVDFGLGSSDPVKELIMTPRGSHTDLDKSLSEIEATLGTSFRIHGEPAPK